jgi:type I restriction enzyme S subunit
MSELPDGWVEAAVDDTGSYINGMAFKPTDWEQDGRPIIRIQNLTDPNKPLNRTTRQVEGRYIVCPGDLLVSWSATLDAFIWDREEAVLNQHIFKVEPNTRVCGHSS